MEAPDQADSGAEPPRTNPPPGPGESAAQAGAGTHTPGDAAATSPSTDERAPADNSDHHTRLDGHRLEGLDGKGSYISDIADDVSGDFAFHNETTPAESVSLKAVGDFS